MRFPLFGLVGLAMVVLTLPVSAQLIVNGDVSSSALTAQLGFTDRLAIGNLDGGWSGNVNTGRTLNARTEATGGVQYDSDSGNPDGFLIVDDVVGDNNDATMWNLFTYGETAIGFTIDVAVLTTYNNNAGNPVDTSTAAAVGNSAVVEYAWYGFDGTSGELSTALTAADIGTADNFLNAPVGEFDTIASGTLSAVGALDTWETQSFSFSNASYDYLLLGLWAPYASTHPAGGVGLDNVTITTVPEPSTVALLGVAGGLLVWGLRRRIGVRR